MAALCALVIGLGLMRPARAADAQNAKPRETDCAAVTDAALRIAIATGRQQLDASWLKSGDGYITRYTIAGEEKNPLLPQAKPEPESAAISGFAYANTFTCAVIQGEDGQSDDGSKVLLKFRADTVRFNEANAGWTAATLNGTVSVMLGARQGYTWTLQPGQGDDTIFPPGTELSPPNPGNLPPHAVWPAKECRLPKLWNGEKCVRPKW
jgi:hypothetical protein